MIITRRFSVTIQLIFEHQPPENLKSKLSTQLAHYMNSLIESSTNDLPETIYK